ncbi:MAG: PIN domain-containing protein [Gammaproteobacteria bacterium]
MVRRAGVGRRVLLKGSDPFYSLLFVVTWPVITETTHLLLSRLNGHAQIRFIESLSKGYIEVFELDRSHLPRIKLLMKKYEDLPMDLSDASLLIAAKQLGDGRILSTDQRDFNTYRWKNHRPFQNLLFND